MWTAFGLHFAALAILAPAAAVDARGARIAWLALPTTWVVDWLPHGIIGVTVALGGVESAKVSRCADWAARPLGRLTLVLDGALRVVLCDGMTMRCR